LYDRVANLSIEYLVYFRIEYYMFKTATVRLS